MWAHVQPFALTKGNDPLCVRSNGPNFSTYLEPLLGRRGQERQVDERTQLSEAWFNDRWRRTRLVLRVRRLQRTSVHVELLDGPDMVHRGTGEQ